MLCVYKGRATFLSGSLMFLKSKSCPRVFSWFSNESLKKKKTRQLVFWAHSFGYTWQLSSSTILIFVAVLSI